jgi:dTDP-glucose pyrophosphorylase
VKTLLLAAGGDQAFFDAGYAWPKNLTEVEGEPLVQRVLSAVGQGASSTGLVVAIQQEENRRYHTGDMLQLLVPNVCIVEVRGLTDGAACTALLAAGEIDNDESLLIVNGDQIVDVDVNEVVSDFERRDLDAGVVTFTAVHPRWSYVLLENSEVIEAAEKRPISNVATAGMYWFRRGSDFVAGAKSMIRKNAAVDGRFFVCPVFNELVLLRRRIGVHHIDRRSYHSLADPSGVRAYEQQLVGSV